MISMIQKGRKQVSTSFFFPGPHQYPKGTLVRTLVGLEVVAYFIFPKQTKWGAAG
jgi:hypothetical protein